MHFNVILSSLIDLNHVIESYKVWRAFVFSVAVSSGGQQILPALTSFFIYFFIKYEFEFVVYCLSSVGTWQTHAQCSYLERNNVSARYIKEADDKL